MKPSVWTEIERIKDAVLTSSSRIEVLKKLDRSPSSQMYRRLKRFEREHNIDTSHFRSWNSEAMANAATRKRKLTSEEIFCEHSLASPTAVKRRILRDGLIPYKCVCGNAGEWLGKKLTLQLEHKNGVHDDHRLGNLCYLCPNCHSQTLTYCGRNGRAPTRS